MEYEYFKRQIKFFSENYNVITMEDLIEFYSGGKELPENAMLLTFDDGYIDNYTNVLPVLMEYNRVIKVLEGLPNLLRVFREGLA